MLNATILSSLISYETNRYLLENRHLPKSYNKDLVHVIITTMFTCPAVFLFLSSITLFIFMMCSLVDTIMLQLLIQICFTFVLTIFCVTETLVETSSGWWQVKFKGVQWLPSKHGSIAVIQIIQGCPDCLLDMANNLNFSEIYDKLASDLWLHEHKMSWISAWNIKSNHFTILGRCRNSNIWPW